MSGLHGRMPYTTAFERAMGTGMIIQSATALDDGFRSKLDAFIDGYESVLSRFRADSLVTAMGESCMAARLIFPIGPPGCSIWPMRSAPRPTGRLTRVWARI